MWYQLFTLVVLGFMMFVPSAVTAQDRTYMQQALELARRGLGLTFPNPAVGCVIVKEGKVCQHAAVHAAAVAVPMPW